MSIPDTTEDAFLGGQLRLRQPTRGHRAGHDAILLAAAVSATEGCHVVDFGAGIGAAGLAVARRVRGIDLTLVEVNADLARLAEANATLNNIAAKVAVLDVTASAEAFGKAGLGADSADAVLMNPPFNSPAHHRPSPDTGRRAAHMAGEETLESWVHAARRILKPGGELTLIWRAEGLGEVLAALVRGFGSLAVRPLHPRPNAPAIRILVRAIKGGRAPLWLCPALVLNDAGAEASQDVEDILNGRASLPFDRALGSGAQEKRS